MRSQDRARDALREITIEPNFVRTAEGSVLISVGRTRVICTASVEEVVPPFLRGQGKGWITSEYAMLPRATLTRSPREVTRGRASGRTHEIQRLIGRSLRSVVELGFLGERTIFIDCDVIEADGGTRTASITGAAVALALALEKLRAGGKIAKSPLKELVAATSVGIVAGEPMLDLDYSEDSAAQVDMNVVMTDGGKFVEVQATAEGRPFEKHLLDTLIRLAEQGIRKLIAAQKDAIQRGTHS
jgi:ribonuclease PH